jgi:hypothetical protein
MLYDFDVRKERHRILVLFSGDELNVVALSFYDFAPSIGGWLVNSIGLNAWDKVLAHYRELISSMHEYSALYAYSLDLTSLIQYTHPASYAVQQTLLTPPNACLC